MMCRNGHHYQEPYKRTDGYGHCPVCRKEQQKRWVLRRSAQRAAVRRHTVSLEAIQEDVKAMRARVAARRAA
jgi:hypothetical protein